MRKLFFLLTTLGALAVVFGWPAADLRAQTTMTSEPNLAIPDYGGAPACYDTITFTQTGEVITSLRVGIRIDHTWQSDLQVLLLPPGVAWFGNYTEADIPTNVAAGAIELVADVGAGLDDFGSGTSSPYTFLYLCAANDPVFGASATPIQQATATAGLSGTYLADDELALWGVYGADPANFYGFGGTWTLVVIDDSSSDDGTLVAWAIEYDSVPIANPPEILVMRGSPIPAGGTDDIGNLSMGAASTVTYDVGNTGVGVLHVAVATTSGATNCMVSVVTPVPFTVAPSDASPLELEVTPFAAGPFSFELSLANDDADENPFVIHVMGTAQVGPPGELLVSGVTALEATLLDTPVSEDWVIENTGAGDLVVAAITLEGPDATAFALGGLPTLPFVLGPSETAPLTMSFTTSSGADATALVRFVSNTGGVAGSVDDVLVSGTLVALAPEIDVQRGSSISSGSTDDLGDRLVGMPIELTFVIENQGTADLTLPGAEPATLGQPLNCDVTVLAQPESPVAPGATTEVIVEVTPQATGTFVVSLMIDSDDEDESTYLITIAGNAVEEGPPNLVVIGNTSFYAVDVGFLDSASWVLQNDGGDDLIITGIDVIGPNAGAFSVSGMSFPTTLATGESASLNVHFVAQFLGTANATVRILSNSGGVAGSTTDMPVTGHATGNDDEPGCNCRSTPGGGLPLVLVLALVFLGIRRRR